MGPGRKQKAKNLARCLMCVFMVGLTTLCFGAHVGVHDALAREGEVREPT